MNWLYRFSEITYENFRGFNWWLNFPDIFSIWLWLFALVAGVFAYSWVKLCMYLYSEGVFNGDAYLLSLAVPSLFSMVCYLCAKHFLLI